MILDRMSFWWLRLFPTRLQLHSTYHPHRIKTESTSWWNDHQITNIAIAWTQSSTNLSTHHIRTNLPSPWHSRCRLLFGPSVEISHTKCNTNLDCTSMLRGRRYEGIVYCKVHTTNTLNDCVNLSKINHKWLSSAENCSTLVLYATFKCGNIYVYKSSSWGADSNLQKQQEISHS